MTPAGSRPPTHDELLRYTRRLVGEQLSALVVRVLGKADDWMFDLSQKEGEGADPFARSPRLEAMTALRSNRAAIERQFAQHYDALFEDLIHPKPVRPAGLSLSLVEDQELEQQLASDLIVEALQRAHGNALDALAKGLSRVMGVEALAPRQNPLSPLNIGHALHHAVKGIELPNTLQVVLYKYYERELLQSFTALLEPLMQRFVAAGLVPRQPLPGGAYGGGAARAGGSASPPAAPAAGDCCGTTGWLWCGDATAPAGGASRSTRSRPPPR